MEEEDFIKGEEILDASDEEPDHILEEKTHAKLLDSISALDGHKRFKLSERTVLTEAVSEFGFNQTKAERKVRLHELIGGLKNTASHGDLKKQLKGLNKRSKVASVPLSKLEEGKIQRITAYERTKDDLSKWNTVVAENRKAEQISFPLQQPSLKLQTTGELKTRFKPRTPLEMEIAALLEKNADSVGTHDAELTPAEEQALKAMSLEEARERRAELQKYRALLTYKQARAKREKKIKSKKYRRIRKKERLKKEKAEMEELKRTDPEAYAEKLEKLERDRVKERMTLKHRGGSKFALRQKLYGKYDDRSREAIQDMLQTHKELTKKVQLEEESDKDSESGVSLHSDEEFDDDMNARMTLIKGDNPWMNPVTKISEFQRPQAVCSTEVARLQEEKAEEEEIKEEDPDESLELEDHIEEKKSSEKIESDAKKKRKSRKKKKVKAEESDEEDCGNEDDPIDSIFETLSKSRLEKVKKLERESSLRKRKKRQKVAREERKLSKTVSGKTKMDTTGQESDEDLLDLSLTRKKTMEDMEGGFEQTGKARKDFVIRGEKHKNEEQMTHSTSTSDDVFVDPKKIFTLETTLRNSDAAEIIMDEDGPIDAEEQQRLTIAQAFADDDVVDEFTKEKADIFDRDKPKDIDLTLPGWGEWGGAGLQPSKRKRKKFVLKAPDAAPRRDRYLGNVIISEKVDDAIAPHQVSRLPFPYTSPQQFQQSIQVPIGKNWNPETAFKKLIKPKVVTKMGTVISPINKSDVFKKKNSNHVEKDLVEQPAKKRQKLKK